MRLIRPDAEAYTDRPQNRQTYIKPDDDTDTLGRPVPTNDRYVEYEANTDEDGPLVPRLSKRIVDGLSQDRIRHEETEVQQAHRLFQEYSVPATYEIIRLALHSSNDRIRLQAATHVVDRALGRVADNVPQAPTDPFRDLLAQCVIEQGPQLEQERNNTQPHPADG